MIIYFLGGEDVKKRTCFEIMRKALADAKNGRVLIIPWTSESKEKVEKYKKILTEYFKDLGAKSITFAELSDTQSTLATKINDADLIYIPGGLPEVFLKYAAQKNLTTLLRNYKGVIVGNSAGALVLCRECVITKDEDHPTTKVMPGLGLVDFSVEVHYTPERDEELKELSKGRKIYAIPEHCALVYQDGVLEFAGNIVLFENGIKRKQKTQLIPSV